MSKHGGPPDGHSFVYERHETYLKRLILKLEKIHANVQLSTGDHEDLQMMKSVLELGIYNVTQGNAINSWAKFSKNINSN